MYECAWPPCYFSVCCCAVQIYYETTRHLSAGQELLLPPREPLQLDMFADTNASLEDRSDRESGQSTIKFYLVFYLFVPSDRMARIYFIIRYHLFALQIRLVLVLLQRYSIFSPENNFVQFLVTTAFKSSCTSLIHVFINGFFISFSVAF